MPPLDTAYKIERALEVYVDNPGGLRQAQKAAVLLFQSRGPGAEKARGLYHRAQMLLNRLQNKHVAKVVRRA